MPSEPTPEEIQAAVERGAVIGRKVARALPLALAGLVGVSICGGAVAVVGLALFVPATIYLHHGGQEPVTVWVDDEVAARITGPGVTTVRLERGDHVLALDRAGERQTFALTGMNGLDDYLIPTDPRVCFAVLDVRWALYDPRFAGARDPCSGLDEANLISTYAAFPMEVGGPRFRIDELPQSVEGGTPVFLTVALPCASLAEANAASLLAREAGCAPGDGAR